jgi:hypothetical protein
LGIAYSQTCRPQYKLQNTSWLVVPGTDLDSCCTPTKVVFGDLWGSTGYSLQTSYYYPLTAAKNPWCYNNNYLVSQSGWSTMALFDNLYQAWNLYINYQYSVQNDYIEVRYTSYDRSFCYFYLKPE